MGFSVQLQMPFKLFINLHNISTAQFDLSKGNHLHSQPELQDQVVKVGGFGKTIRTYGNKS